MSSLVIVAIPSEDDYVNKISSEKIAHMTLLFLGEADKVKNVSEILGFVGHAAKQSLMRFGLEVDRRGVLGDEEADVLFFSKSKWSGFEQINNFRSYLLKNDNIRAAYDSAEQFPEWIPHLTLGTSDSPAKPDERDYPGINYVNFDRIAVWFGDYEGVEFPLKAYDWDLDVAMSTVTPKDRSTQGELAVSDILEHHGVKGMKWGVRRKATVGPEEVIVRDSRFPGSKRIVTKGGRGHPTTSEAASSRTIGRIGQKSGTKALTNKQLEEYNKRLNLEQNFKRLSYDDKNPGQKFVATLLGQGRRQLSSASNEVAAHQVRKRLVKRGLVSAGKKAAVAAAV